MKSNDVLGPYGEIIEPQFYIDRYKVLPSILTIEMPLKETYENMNKVFHSVICDQQVDILTEKWKVSKKKSDKINPNPDFTT